MKKTVLMFSILLIGLLSLATFAQEEQTQSQPAGPDGKKVFVDQKCNMCHSLKKADVPTSTGKYITSTETNVPPDLSGIGDKRNAEWIGKYLKKKEAVNGVTHARLFRGTEAELQILAKWLESQK